MNRHKVGGQHVSHDRWLVSYADFITLLFAFFVVLYASAEMDKKKIVELSAAIHGAFQQMGVFSGAPQSIPGEGDHAALCALPSKKAAAIQATNGEASGANIDAYTLQRELE